MVADFRGRYLESKGLDLGRTFGVMSTVNSVVAIASGVVSEWLVGAAGTKKAPFGLCVGVLGIAALCIYTQWVRSSPFSHSPSAPVKSTTNTKTGRKLRRARACGQSPAQGEQTRESPR